jgi:hypothetical protein
MTPLFGFTLSSTPPPVMLLNPFHTVAPLYAVTEEEGTVKVILLIVTPLKTSLLMRCGVRAWLVTEVNLLQEEKAELSISVTNEGMVTEIKPLQPENAELPIDVTNSGIVTEVKPLQL